MPKAGPPLAENSKQTRMTKYSKKTFSQSKSAGPDSGAHLYRSRFGRDGAHGHSLFWWDGIRDTDHVCCSDSVYGASGAADKKLRLTFEEDSLSVPEDHFDVLTVAV